MELRAIALRPFSTTLAVMNTKQRAIIYFEAAVAFTPVFLIWVWGTWALLGTYGSEKCFGSLGCIDLMRPTISVIFGALGLLGLASLLWATMEEGKLLFKRHMTLLMLFLGIVAIIASMPNPLSGVEPFVIVFYWLPLVATFHMGYWLRGKYSTANKALQPTSALSRLLG